MPEWEFKQASNSVKIDQHAYYVEQNQNLSTHKIWLYCVYYSRLGLA